MRTIHMLKRTINHLLRSRGYELRRVQSESTGELASLAFGFFRFSFPAKLFVQIGASDGQFNDPVVVQVKSGPNPAILVEPVPRNFAALQANYANCPNVRLVQAAMSHNSGTQRFYAVKRAGRWAQSLHASQLGSFDRQHLLNHGVMPEEIDELEVPCQTFSTLLDRKEIQNVGFILSDTEGYDSRVVELALEAGCLPEFICFEFIHLRGNLGKTCQLLSRAGYRFLYDKQNCLAYRETMFH